MRRVSLIVLTGTLVAAALAAVAGSVSSLDDEVDVEAVPTPADAPAPPTATPTASYPGRPPQGTVLWGAAVGGNADPAPRHEGAGPALQLRRTFFQWGDRAGAMVAMARGDLVADRLPWVSVKTPAWEAMGAGEHDAEIDQMLRGLDDLPGPVWLTVHHEPEGGGGVNAPDDPAGPGGHLAMNRRVRQRMTALGVDNIALAPVLMSWSWDERSGRDPDAWWDGDVYDFLGVDHYAECPCSLLTDRWRDVREWAHRHGVDIAVGEWGTRGDDVASGERVREWYEAALASADDDLGSRVVALAAFDSGLNAPAGSWELRGGQLEVFGQVLRHSRRLAGTGSG